MPPHGRRPIIVVDFDDSALAARQGFSIHNFNAAGYVHAMLDHVLHPVAQGRAPLCLDDFLTVRRGALGDRVKLVLCSSASVGRALTR